MKSLRFLPVLAALLPTLAPAAPVYNSLASSPATLTALGSSSSPTETKLTSSLNDGTSFGFIYARAKLSSTTSSNASTYEFQLVSLAPASSTGAQVGSYWNVSRDGVLLCSQCLGYFSGNSSGAGKPFTISVDNGNYKLVATITSFTQI